MQVKVEIYEKENNHLYTLHYAVDSVYSEDGFFTVKSLGGLNLGSYDLDLFYYKVTLE